MSVTWCGAGVVLLLYAVALVWLSDRTASASIDVDTAALCLMLFSVPAGLIYVIGLRSNTGTRVAGWAFPWIIVAGFAMRVIVMMAPPSVEDDFNRYLWDGAVTAHGLNPYRYSPTHVLWAALGAESVPPAFVQLAGEAGPILERVNHPNLTTIYPPLAQLSFAAAYAMTPWSTDSWRFVLLLADAVTLVILVRFMLVLGVPLVAVALYWWNPVLLRETYGGAHMDVLVLPFVIGAVWLAVRKRFYWSMFILALAVGVKLWPIILAPILLRPLWATPKRMFLSLGILLATSAPIWAPAVPSAFGPDSGFLAYTASWRNNAGAFALLEGFCRYLLSGIGDGHPHWAQPMTRVTIGVIMLAWIAWLARKPVVDDRDLPRRCCLVVAALFLLAPAPFPWYYVWLVPFLTMTQSASLLSYSFLLPLYYVHVRHPGIVWLEHGLVWLLLAREVAAGLIHRRRPYPVESHPYSEARC